MIKRLMSKTEGNAARKAAIKKHITDIKRRHSEPQRREAVALLEELLKNIPDEQDDFQTKSKIQEKIRPNLPQRS